MKVIMMSGVPGSGKSTLVARRWPGAVVFSADAYFMVDGEYRFDPSRIGEAHCGCLRSFTETLQVADVEVLVVDNTNLSVSEIAPYAALAQAYGATSSSAAGVTSATWRRGLLAWKLHNVKGKDKMGQPKEDETAKRLRDLEAESRQQRAKIQDLEQQVRDGQLQRARDEGYRNGVDAVLQGLARGGSGGRGFDISQLDFMTRMGPGGRRW